MFRNLSGERSSDLIRDAVRMTIVEWHKRYGEVPVEMLQTEIKPSAVKSGIPGYCYRRAGWVKVDYRRGLLVMRCPRTQIDRVIDREGLR